MERELISAFAESLSESFLCENESVGLRWEELRVPFMMELLGSELRDDVRSISLGNRMLEMSRARGLSDFPASSFAFRNVVAVQGSRRLYAWVEDVLGENGSGLCEAEDGCACPPNPMFTAVLARNMQLLPDMVQRHPEWINVDCEQEPRDVRSPSSAPHPLYPPRSAFMQLLVSFHDYSAVGVINVMREAGAKILPGDFGRVIEEKLRDMYHPYLVTTSLSSTSSLRRRSLRALVLQLLPEILDYEESKVGVATDTHVLFFLLDSGLLTKQILEILTCESLPGKPFLTKQIGHMIRASLCQKGNVDFFRKAIKKFDNLEWLAELVRRRWFDIQQPAFLSAIIESERMEWLSSVAFTSADTLHALLVRTYRILILAQPRTPLWLSRSATRALVDGFVLRRLFRTLCEGSSEPPRHLPQELWLDIAGFLLPVVR
jgi:hypothetical protein